MFKCGAPKLFYHIQRNLRKCVIYPGCHQIFEWHKGYTLLTSSSPLKKWWIGRHISFLLRQVRHIFRGKPAISFRECRTKGSLKKKKRQKWDTLPETNMTPENRPKRPKRKRESIPTIQFQDFSAVSFRDYIHHIFAACLIPPKMGFI